MGIRRGVLGDGADSGGLGVDVLEDKLKLSEVDNLSSNPCGFLLAARILN